MGDATLVRLSRDILALRSMAQSVVAPLRLRVESAPVLQAVNLIAAALGVRPFEAFMGDRPLNAFERVAESRLALDEDRCSALGAWTSAPGAMDALAREARSGMIEDAFERSEIPTGDGCALHAYVGGNTAGATVVIVAACGMPIALSEKWIRALAEHYRVVTWETRGLFGETLDFDAARHDVGAQAGDLSTVMDYFGVERAHLMGLCGGAVVAISAAAERPDRFPSLSLWYGDYHLGEGTPKTKHQRDLVQLMAMARGSRKQAASLQKLFADPAMLANVRNDVAHLVLYPYLNGELLYRYSRLNGAIMETDIQPLLERVTAPTLVVTSEDDSTAHPEGSRRVAAGLRAARLHVDAHGDHLSLFDAGPERTVLAQTFIDA